MTERISIERHDGWSEVRLTRPEALNAVDPLMVQELLGAFRDLRADRETRSVVLSAEGRAFSAGADLNSVLFMEPGGAEASPVPQAWESPFYGADLLEWQHELIKELWSLPQLTIAAVQGPCVGGAGFGVAMACDLRFAAPDAQFWMIPSFVNVVQDWGLAWLLQKAVGPTRATYAYFSGDRIDAQKAQEWGIVVEVSEDPAEKARAFAERVGAMGAHAVRHGKALLRRSQNISLDDELLVEALNNGLCFLSDDFKEKKAVYKRK